MSDTSQNQSLEQLQRAALALKRLRAKLDALEYAKTEPIAIIGMGCRLPGTTGNVCGPDDFWDLLRSGGDAISEVPPDRWDADALYDPNPDAPGKIYTRWGGFLRDIEHFDAALFGIAPREATSMDPQQRLLLEVVWEALEHAGQAPDALKKTKTGVFVGIGIGDYATMQTRPEHAAEIDAYTGTGTGFCFASGRLSYILGVHGPSLSVDTACSSSLVAIHLACQSLRNQECQIALAGGVNAMLAPEAMLFLAKSRALSPTGRCRTFDAAADGFVRGEGCGVLVLKRLSDALADGDTVLAVVSGSAINHDGPSSGLTVPNGHAQQSLIREALEHAQIAPSEVGYVEAHGTGTNLGDPIELRALGAVLGEGRARSNPLVVGSVKTNIGHLEAAAGVTGVIKTVLALQHGAIPPHLHFREPSPHIPWADLSLTIPTVLMPWPARSGQRRIAGVSSFGLSGTNAHVLIAEAPQRAEPESEPAAMPQILALSAKSDAALLALVDRYEHLLDTNPALPLADLCFTANTGRAYLSRHLAVLANSPAQLRSRLADVVAGRETPGLFSGQTRTPRRPKIAFLCTGQGSQYIGMGRELYETEPVFREALDRCAAIVSAQLGSSLLAVVYPESPAAASIDDTLYTQPALIALEYALAELWRSWGIVPSAVLGHSVGEYAAAIIAGIFSLEDGLRLVVERARLMQSLPLDGSMLAVSAAEERVRAAILPYADEVAIAALNGPQHVVISGRRSTIEMLAGRFAAEGIKTRRLPVSHAFHSPLMQPILADFARVARSIQYARPKIEVIANLSGEADAARMATPDYWIEHVLQPVRFAAGVQTLQRRGHDIWIEIGPRPVLLGMARQNLAAESDETPWLWLPSLRQNKAAREQILDSLAALHAQGVRVDWSGFYDGQRRRKLALPTYPFQRQRYWPAMSSAPRRTTVPSNAGRGEANRLPGQRIYSPAFTRGEIQFELLIDRQANSLIQRSSSTGLVSLLDAAYTEIALAAGAAAFNAERALVADLEIRQPLTFSEDAAATLQIILTPESPSSYGFQITSLGAETGAAPSWTCHAAGRILEADSARSTADLLSGVELLYQTTWQPIGLPVGPPLLTGRSWLILADPGGTGHALAEMLRERGDRCTLVFAGTSYARRAAAEYVIDPSSPANMRRIVAEWTSADQGPFSGVIHLWSLDTPFASSMPAETVQQAQVLGCGSALFLTQALAGFEWSAPPRLWLVTRGSQPVAPSEQVQPLQGPLWGLGHVIALEHPEFHCVCLDLDPISSHDDARLLLAALSAADPEPRVAYRQGSRYAARLSRSIASQPQQQQPLLMPIRSDSAYLITGGLGGLGIAVARWMVAQGAGAIVLLSRRAANVETRAVIAELEQSGARVVVAQADAGSADAVATVLEQIRATLPPLRGIVHAAGLIEDGLIRQQSWEQFQRVMQPKVAGAWNLHLLTLDQPLDFFVCFSSIASVFGSPGQANYAAANAFLDGLAHYRRSIGLPATTINWGPWAGAGMEAGNERRRTAQGLGLIDPRDGVQTLGWLLQSQIAQATVLRIEWESFVRQLPPGGLHSFFSDLLPHASNQATQQPIMPEQLANVPARERTAWLTAQVRGVIAQVLGAPSPQEIALREGLFEQGLDSLMALEVKNRLEAQSGSVLPQTFIFDYPLVESIVEYFSRSVFPDLFQTAATAPSEAAHLPDLADLSDDEAEALLLAELDKINR